MCVLPSLQVPADAGRPLLPNDPATLDIGQYAAALGIAAPWKVSDVSLDPAQRIVDVIVRHEGADLCPVCGQAAAEYDTKLRRWQHFDLCQYQCFITVEVPRFDCPTHGVKDVPLLWAGLTWYS